jgi:GTPase SAR1 family protein
MANNAMQRPVLGQWAVLGSLYDARTDTFVSRSLLKSAPPTMAVSVTGNPNREILLTFNDSYRERLSKMKIGAELGASFLSGLVNVDGAANYLKDTRNSNLVEQASIHYIITTVEEKLSFANPELRAYLTLDPIQGSGATHVLAGIGWGAQTIVTAKHQLFHDSDRARVRGHIETEFRKIESIITTGGSPGFQYQNAQRGENISFDIIVCSDVLAEIGHTTDFKRASDFITDLPNKIAAISSGRGVPLTYTLIPLNLLSFILNVDVKADVANSQPSLNCLESFLVFFDELRDAQQKLNDYHLELTRHQHCVPPQYLDIVARCMQNSNMAEATLKSNYARLLKDVRGGFADPAQLIQLLEGARRGVASSKDIADMTNQYRDKMAFANDAVASGISYFGYGGGPIEMELQRNNIDDAYVLYFTEKIRHECKSWGENHKLLLQLLKGGAPNCVIAMVDCDATGARLERACISRFQKGNLVVPDVLQQLTFGKCVARYIKEEDLDKSDAKKPLRRSAVQIACPGPNCNKSVAYDWICHKCEAPIEYGAADQYMYCDCGRSPYGNYGFKCRELEHGRFFERYEKSMLLQLLDSLDPLDELNVLIIGETGVGKSTFINAFINYLTFDTLDESMNNEELNWVIPCSFNVQNMDRSNPNGKITQTKIKVGQDDDEADGASGVSATQKTMVYPVTLGNTVVRLIDTPGIGDTRGVEKDKENMANILAMLRNFDKLHGILFLLKSNSSRLNFMFRFVVEELLTHLHRDAARNMVFGFTNTRISNYTPGDTYTPLESLLARHRNVGISLSPRTVYCFDSESFRFLAAQKNGVIMDNIQDFRSSWELSGGEAKRLLEHFRSLAPHLVRSTLSLNRTRDLIMHLTRPMADIMQKIDKTILLNVDNMQELTDTRLKGDQLRGRLHWEKIELVSHALDKPRTVCNDVACKEYRDDGSGKRQTIYKSLCHKECFLTNVPPEVISCVELMNCAAFNGKENCKVCGHHWESHLHINTELEEKMVTVKDEAVEERLTKNASDIALKEAAIQNLKNKIAEADYEYKEIQDAAVRFGIFLKKNSITPYNDAMLAYLDHLIKEELDKVNATQGGREILDGLLRHRLEHVQQVEVLTKNMESGSKDELLDETGVEDLVEHLYHLKHWGKNLRDIKDNAEATHLAAYRERPYRLQGRNPSSSWSSSSSWNSSSGWTSSSLSSGISWLAGKVTTSLTVAETPRNNVNRRVSTANQSRNSVPRNIPVAEANRNEMMQVQTAPPRKLQPLRPPRSEISSLLEMTPASKSSMTTRLLRPFSKRF